MESTPAMRLTPEARSAGLWLAGCLVLVAVPFLLVRYPPITDLPQHVAQIRLFIDAVTNPMTFYKVQWLTPYGASFVLLGLTWFLFGPAAAGRIAFLVMALVWVAAVHWLGWRRKRAATAAVLATILVFNHTLYWGFYSFLAGWPLFCIALETERGLRRKPFGWRSAAILFALTVALYFTHALWFAFTGLWVALVGLRLPWRAQLARLSCFAPLGLLAAWWFPHLAQRGFYGPTFWDRIGFARMTLDQLADSVLGGITGNAEPLMVGVLIVWIAWGWLSSRGRWRVEADLELLAVGGLFFLLGIFLPYTYQNTIRFAHRWMPFAGVLLILGSPQPSWRPALRKLLVASLLCAYVAATALTWVTFEKVELAGLQESLDALPDQPMVMGLNYVWDSPRILTHAYVQIFAYAQVLHGGDLNFSFADFAPCLVVFQERRWRPWTNGLEWYPTWVKKGDFQFFDYVLLHGDQVAHQEMARRVPLEPVTAEAPWRLYRVPRKAKAAP
jgi:hypothetical protein